MLFRSGGQYIDITLVFGVNDTCDINVGGALATLQHALDTVDATDFDMDIHINLDTAVAVDDDVFGGAVAKNTKRKVIGYKTIPGDMNYGETYYQSPIDSYNDGIDTNCFVGIDGGGGNIQVLTIDGIDNTIWENLYIHNTDKALNNNAVHCLNTPENPVFINCRFDTVSRVITNNSANGMQFRECMNGDDCGHQLIALGLGGLIINGVWQEPIDSSAGIIGVAVGASGIITGNVVIGGTYGIRALGYVLAKNNV